MNSTASVIDAQQRFDPEAALISAAQQGDKQAFHRLYENYLGMVYGVCLRLMVDRALAEDATQEVFIQLWHKLSNFRGDSKFSTWLHSVAANVAISQLRKQRSWLSRVFSSEDVDISDVAAPEVEDHQEDKLAMWIARLPERTRIVFVLHAIDGYRHEEIAQMTNMAVGSSKAQFHRAKQMIKEWMGHE